MKLSSLQQESIMRHLELILVENKKLNLTRISDQAQAEILHIEDSLVAIEELNDAPEGLYADLGTGAGYPGIPLSIVSGRKTTLVDSVQKKALVLSEIIETLGLTDQISVYPGRIEDFSKDQPLLYSAITARALTSLPSLLELASPLLRTKGHLICYKARLHEEELKHAQSLKEVLGLQYKSDRKVILSDGITLRRIVVFEKIAPAKVKLPRKIGLAQKRPLV